MQIAIDALGQGLDHFQSSLFDKKERESQLNEIIVRTFLFLSLYTRLVNQHLNRSSRDEERSYFRSNQYCDTYLNGHDVRVHINVRLICKISISTPELCTICLEGLFINQIEFDRPLRMTISH